MNCTFIFRKAPDLALILGLFITLKRIDFDCDEFNRLLLEHIYLGGFVLFCFRHESGVHLNSNYIPYFYIPSTAV